MNNNTIDERKARILARLPQAPVCICLEHIGDNGPCPVHVRKPTPKTSACDNAIVFVLEDGSNYCMSCGGDHG